jgi:hypothetical protein
MAAGRAKKARGGKAGVAIWQGLPDGVPKIQIRNRCCCGFGDDCRDARASHELGANMEPMPQDLDKFNVFAAHLHMPEDAGGGWALQHAAHAETDQAKRQKLLYAHIHHLAVDREFRRDGQPKVKSGVTGYADDRYAGSHLVPVSPPIPSRQFGTGQFAVGASPSKHANPVLASIAASASKAQRAAAADAALADAPDTAAKEERREEAGYHAPEDKRGVDPSDYPAGSAITTIERVVALVNEIDSHARHCTGTLCIRPGDTAFVGVVMSLGGRCRVCKKRRIVQSLDPSVLHRLQCPTNICNHRKCRHRHAPV